MFLSASAIRIHHLTFARSIPAQSEKHRAADGNTLNRGLITYLLLPTREKKAKIFKVKFVNNTYVTAIRYVSAITRRARGRVIYYAETYRTDVT